MALDSPEQGNVPQERNMLAQIAKFEKRYNDLIDNSIWAKKEDQKVKVLFEKRYTDIEQTENLVHHEALSMLLLDMLAYIDMFKRMGLSALIDIGEGKSNYSERARNFYNNGNGKYEYNMSHLHEQILLANETEGRVPPAHLIERINNTVRGTIGQI